MSSNVTKALIAIIIIQFGIIAALIIDPRHLVVRKNVSPVIIEESPIALAAKYDAPDQKFEEVVKKNLRWLPYRVFGDSFTVLAECAYKKQTNYVRILIDNGANVEEAIKELSGPTEESKEAIALLEQIQTNRARHN